MESDRTESEEKSLEKWDLRESLAATDLEGEETPSRRETHRHIIAVAPVEVVVGFPAKLI